MSSVADKSRRRSYDAQASREALLGAARALFDARGYEATTVRDIGERAHVDPALIARYFGGKEGLYLASLAHGEERPAVDDPAAFLERLLSRHEARGIGPVGLAMVSPTLSDAMREQVRDIVHARAIEPLAGALRERGTEQPELRAAVLLAAAVGLSLVRAGGTVPALAGASTDDLLDALAPLLAAAGGSAG